MPEIGSSIRNLAERFYQTLWSPVAEPANPISFGRDIAYTFEAYPGVLRLRPSGPTSETIAGAAGVNNALGTQALENTYLYVLAVDMFHTDPIARDAAIHLLSPSGVGVALVTVNALPNTQRLALPRPLLVPALFRLRAQLAAIAAGETVSIQAHFVFMDLVQPPPPL